MIRSFAAIAYNGFREARRNRVTALVFAFAIALVLSSALAVEATVSTFDRVVIDVGLGSLSLMLVLMSIYLSSGLLNREIERRTIYLMVTKPISRGTFLLARLAGNMLTLGVLLTLMSLVFFLQLALTQNPIEAIHVLSLVLLWFELLILSSIGVTMSTFSSPIVSGLVTIGVFFAGHLSGDVYALGQRAKLPILRVLATTAYYLVPNLERLNLRPRATYHLAVDAADVWGAIAYAIAYAGCFLVIGVAIFRRRDFK
jgi:Cu-processing system permease protein